MDGNPEIYPGVVALIDQRAPQIFWWDLAWVHDWADARGHAGYKFTDWRRKFATLVGGEGVKLRTDDTGPNVYANICTTASLF